MKVFAVNSSPRTGNNSKTELMLNHLTNGMHSVGADVEIINLRNKKIKNCHGCFKCWMNVEGMCVQTDDITRELFPKWLESDLVIYATPLYHYSMNATMKMFIERTLPILNPAIKQSRGGRSYHPLRHKQPKIIMLSVAAFVEESVFEVLSHHVNYMFGKGLLAEIYRTASEAMVGEKFRDKLSDILDATARAGQEIVTSMKISPETIERIKQPIHS